MSPGGPVSQQNLVSNAPVRFFSNNSIEVNLLEVEEKEKFLFESINNEGTETDSHVGKIAGDLQQETFRIFQRKR